MDSITMGNTIRSLREKAGITQAELALRLSVSDKTVSKWECGGGFPDITLLPALAEALHTSVGDLLEGNLIHNTNISANMLRTKFYVCPCCGNVLSSVGEATVSCHGFTLPPVEFEAADEAHALTTQQVEDELYVSLTHPMTKDHYISFIAALGADRVQLVKLYPEGPAEARFKRAGIRKFLWYCNKEGGKKSE